MLACEKTVMDAYNFLKKKEAEAAVCEHEWADIYPASAFGRSGCVKCGISKRGFDKRKNDI